MLSKVIVYFFIVFVYCVHCDEGSECIADDGTRGICVPFNRCMAVVQELKEGRRPQICSFNGKSPIVCCTDCDMVNDTRHVVVDNSGGFYFKTGRHSYDKCLDYMVSLPYSCSPSNGLSRIWDEARRCYKYEWIPVYGAVGGMDAKRAEYPHMALLGYGENVDAADWLCGGSVISDRFILTAAHCTSASSLGPVTYVALGILKRTDPPSLWQRHKVKRIIPHPEYRPPSKYHDIAILETEDKIKFNRHVLPACLNTGHGWDSNAWATGWGTLGHRQKLADTLQTVFLQKFTEEECLVEYPPHRHLTRGYDPQRQLCYGDKETPRDTCQGDSGGPLQTTGLYSSCQHVVLGVTSYGRACGLAGAGMYTRVEHYAPWIESLLQPEDMESTVT